jgi:hypothetical protein
MEKKEYIMQLLNKHKGAANALNDNTTYRQHNTVVEGLQALREIAWHKALKYRFDPVLSRTHEEYLSVLNNLLAEYAV